MSDYNFLMESRLALEQFRVLNHISRIAGELGLNVYLVGGSVRDLTYGQQTNEDLDFAIDGNPQRLLGRLGPPRKGKIPRREPPGGLTEPAPLELEYLRFDPRRRSAAFTFTNGVRGEIAVCRNEVYSKPGRPPEILPGTIFEDLKRRDLSVNAMAVSLHPNSRGLLLDPTNGGADVENRELRVLHSRSLSEDPSRIYRLLRLRSRLDFRPEERTKQYLELALENRYWERMTPEQRGVELRAILQEENPGRVLKMFAERGLLAGLDRKVARTRIPHDCLARVRSAVRLLPGTDPFLLNFHCLVEKLGAAQKNRLARMTVLHKAEAKLVFGFDREAKRLARPLKGSRAALPSRVYALLSGQPQHLLLFMLAHHRQAKVQNRIKNYLLKYPQIRAKLPRTELETLGVKAGPKFEKILEQVFRDQLDGKVKNHPQVMKALRAYAGIKEPPPKPAKAVKPAKSPARAAGRPAPPAKPASSAAPVVSATKLPLKAAPAKSPARAAAKPAAPAKPASSAPPVVSAIKPPLKAAPAKPSKPAKPAAAAKPARKKSKGKR